VLDARGWAGRRPCEVGNWLDQLPLVSGITAVAPRCREEQLVPLLATLTWEPVGLYLCERFGFEGTCGPSHEVLEGRYTGGVGAHFDEEMKRDYAFAAAAHLGREPKSCVAIGDSRSDVPLFECVGLAVAYNATAAARADCSGERRADDLRALLPPGGAPWRPIAFAERWADPADDRIVLRAPVVGPAPATGETKFGFTRT
jgi:phosphoserine phosphatase